MNIFKTATFKKTTPFILALHNYLDSFDAEASAVIHETIDHGLNDDETIYLNAQTQTVCGVISELHSMGHGDDLISVAEPPCKQK